MRRLAGILMATLILLLCSCRLDCSNLPVKYEAVVLPVRVENESDLKCQQELNYWKDLASQYRDSSGCGYEE
jgi:hypothetical protein